MRVLVNGLTSKYGGVESLFLNILKNNNTDIIFDFICLDNVAANEEEFLALGARIYYITRFREDRRKHRSDLESVFSNGYDVYHINMTRYYVPADISIAKRHGCKVILHSHSSHIYMTDSWTTNFLRKAEFILFKNYYIVHSDKRIACSISAGQYLFGRSDYDVIYNGIDYSHYYFNLSDRVAIRKAYKISDSDFLIGHVGRFQDEKNQAFIVQLIDKLSTIDKKYKCILIGDGPLYAKIKKTISAHKLDQQFILTGNRNDVNKLYSAMDVFILPSKHEALPLCLIEAQVNGLPCVKSNNITDEVDLIQVEKIGIQYKDIERWCNCLINRDAFQRIDSKVVDTRFNIDSFIKQLNKLYHDLIQ